MDMEEHEHKWKNGLCECGAESKRGEKRRLARERRRIATEYKKWELYSALCAKDGKQAIDFKNYERI
ncbi:Hypothetical Protein OBI_RACECAR_264 [Arthrobacter phage Racecar]|nr:hypothetical protein PBI_RACECAR_56 [Arthrobacter phage Racecar]QFG12740.1 hypothetical protein PBI_MIMI_56 [Arthrobacter phage Mimi]